MSQGPPPRMGLIQRELHRFDAPRYLEVGVFDGRVFLALRAASKVAVDPRIRISRIRRFGHMLRHRASFHELPSDEFFASLDPDVKFDVVFVDGLHLWEQALRDTENSLAHLAEGGVILMHDCNPQAEAVASRDPEEAAAAGRRAWCGDVWKAVVVLRATRADLMVEVLDTDFGIGVVRRGSSETLAIEGSEVANLTYADLDADREALLGLVPAASG